MKYKISFNKPLPRKCFKKGMCVLIRTKEQMKYKPSFSWIDSMDFLHGKAGRIVSVKNGCVKLSGIDTEGWTISTDMLLPARAKEIKEVEKMAAEEAKNRKERLAKLPDSAKKIVKLFEADTSAFGCQRKNVLAVVSALIGVDMSGLVQ